MKVLKEVLCFELMEKIESLIENAAPRNCTSKDDVYTIKIEEEKHSEPVEWSSIYVSIDIIHNNSRRPNYKEGEFPLNDRFLKINLDEIKKWFKKAYQIDPFKLDHKECLKHTGDGSIDIGFRIEITNSTHFRVSPRASYYGK